MMAAPREIRSESENFASLFADGNVNAGARESTLTVSV
jgi:hypothetical protein